MKKVTYILAVIVLLSGCTKPQPQAWEHGYKTDRIIATRFKSDMIGYNIGFSFPKNPEDCDDEVLVRFVESHGGEPYEMGGYPGAMMYVVFKDVHNKEDANRKLLEILPDFDEVVRKL